MSFRDLMEDVEVQKEHLIDELAAAKEESESGRMGEEDKRELITRLLNQYENFYGEKSRTAKRDVFQLFAPSWCSSLENAILWITGFRPTSLFPIVTASVHNLSEEQQTRLNRLKRETRVEEKAIDRKQAEIQETLASKPIINVMREIGRRPSSANEADEDMHGLRTGTKAMVLDADRLRTKTATRVVDILDSGQSITFLHAATIAQRSMNALGVKRDVFLQVKSQGECAGSSLQ